MTFEVVGVEAVKVFDAKGAVRAKTQREANEAAGMCPNCGAPADVDLIDVSSFDRPYFIAGTVHCSARCYERDPDAYLAALASSKSSTHKPAGR